MTLYDQIFKPKNYQLSNGKVIQEKKSRMPLYFLLTLIVLIIALKVTEFSLETILSKGKNALVMLEAMFHPDWDYLPKVIEPLFDTLKMSFFGSFIGSLLALPAAFLAANNMVKAPLINWLIKLLFTLIRTIPTLVSALIATYIFGLGTLAGTVAIFLFSFSYIGKIMYEEIETVNMGAHEAMISMGFSESSAFLKGIIPLIMPTYISTSLFNFEGNVRYASILGYVGAGGLGLLINENIGWRDYERVGTILFSLLITVFIIEQISRYCRHKLS
ncbi:phosphonate ABC transporter, permease protein PhnE [Facklamia hominis]|uniref:Phosphonate ABC transporter, permease protein PhnE n=1 Tax=Facklamia hominis TaxID=178214 RepID=A0AAJ1Q2V1_9LACT|nr:phosphonate ABC transporter, permease protein PhnE [Facklamia hominis]MDK7186713.1 phosphonate ABC transporter, permease protein PhnE [Facklamia hominis]